MNDLKYQAKLDIERFTKLHLWFKLLSVQGKNFIIFPWKGEQHKNYINPEIDINDTGYHWHFWDADNIEEIPIEGIGKDIIMRRLVNFNCFLWGLDYSENGGVYTRGWSIITRRYPKLEKTLKKKHNKTLITDIIKIEQTKQVLEALNNIYEIMNEMQKFCPELLGLNYNKMTMSDPTHQICKSNLKLNFSSEMVSSSEGDILQIKRGEESKNIISRNSKNPSSPRKRLIKKVSFRDVKSSMKFPQRKESI